MAKVTKARHAEAIQTLKALCPRGTQIFTIARGFNRNGDRHKFDLYVMQRQEDGSLWPRYLNSLMRDAGLGRQDRNGHLVVEGGGMDMAFSIVYDLSYLLYGKDEAGNYDREGAQSLKREAL